MWSGIREHRARVAAVRQDGLKDYCYFIAHGTEADGERVPGVTGEHMFNLPAQWEAIDARP